MVIGGFSYAGTLTRPAASSPASSDAAAQDSMAEADAPPTYFRSISSISPGSLAAAYQAIKAQEAKGSAAAAGSGAQPPRPGGPAILSGLGIPAALSAYGEAMETGES